jgi:hypothetical protein
MLRVEAGRLEYLYLSPASRRRRPKWNPVPGGITAILSPEDNFTDLVLQVGGWTQG